MAKKEPTHGAMVWRDGAEPYQPIKHVARNYAKMMESGDYLSNKAAVDIIDQRVMTLIERIDLEQAPERLKQLYALWETFKQAKKNDDENGMYAAMMQMDGTFEQVYHDYAAWEQMVEVLDLRRKMVDSELKIIKEKKAFLSVDMAYKLVAQLLAVCIRLIKDPKLLKQINYEFSRIIGENKMQAPEVIDMEDEEAEEDE